MEDPVERYLTTVFSYGCNLGPTQTARSLGNIDRRQIAWINQRHISEETLELAIRHIINSYNKFIPPRLYRFHKIKVAAKYATAHKITAASLVTFSGKMLPLDHTRFSGAHK